MKIKCIRYLYYYHFTPDKEYDCEIEFLKSGQMHLVVKDDNNRECIFGASYAMQSFAITKSQIDKLRIFQ